MALTNLTKPRARWATFKLKVAQAVSRSLYDKLVGMGVSPSDFGAVEGQLATAQIQAALDFQLAGGVVNLEGKSYLSDTLNMPEGTKIHNGKIALNTAGTTLVSLSSYCKLHNITLEGTGNSGTQQLGELLIRAGTSDLSQVSSTIMHIKVTGCHLINSKGSAVSLAYVKYGIFHSNIVKDVRYSGFISVGVDRVKIDHNIIDGVTGTTEGTSYGITFTSTKLVTVANGGALSTNCTAIGNTISNVTKWNAIDTHGGRNITVSGNNIKNCAFPIGVVELEKVGEPYIPPSYVVVSGNTIDNSEHPSVGDLRFGIALTGVASDRLAKGCVISNNTLIECGQAGNNIGGAINTKNTEGAVISSNSIIRPYVFGVCVVNDNVGISVFGNTVVDAGDGTVTVPSAVAVRSTGNSGMIGNNSAFKTGDSSLLHVGVRGLYISASNPGLIITPSYSNYDTHVSGLLNVSSSLLITDIVDNTGGNAGNTTLAAITDTTATDQSVSLNNNLAKLSATLNKVIGLLRERGEIL